MSLRIFTYSQVNASLWLFLIATAVLANENDDLDQVFGGDPRMISLATGYQQKLSEAPTSATVVTAEEIDKLGARTLDEVLRTVTGLHMTSARLVTADPIIRGVTTETGGNVLIMINGTRIESPLTGSGLSFEEVLVENIARVEVIRGPGSAMYGADAVAGVINIVTKTARDIDGVVVGARAGSFNTYDGWALYGGDWGEVDAALMIMGRTSNGDDPRIDADAQTFLDQQTGTMASLAPGPANKEREIVDVRLDLSSHSLTLRANYQNKTDATGTGFVNALDPDGKLDSERLSVELEYQDEVSKNIELKTLFSFRQDVKETRLNLLPSGTFGVLPNGTPTVFPDGVRSNGHFTERQILGEISSIYSGFNKHKVRIGAGGYVEEIDDTRERRNFLIAPGGLLIPTGVFTDTNTFGVSTAQVDRDRTVVYGFAQDEWRLVPDWILTAGFRVDSFSSVGTSANPRVGLIWNADVNSTVKVLAGRAFRAPAFIELFDEGSLIAEGNRDLDPETLTSVELSFDYRPRDWYTTVTAYWLEIEDRIQTISDPQSAPSLLRFDNAGDQSGYGIEVAGGWNILPTLNIKGNYALQNIEDEDSNQDAGIAPKHKLYAEVNWEPRANWRANLNVLSIHDRARQPGDPRRDIDDYTWVNFYLQRKNIGGHVDVNLGVSNLFDDDAREPSTSATSLPNDFPLEGRSIFGEIITRF